MKICMPQLLFYRYVATTSGAVWIYPGTLMPKTFDPARSPW